MEGKDWETLKQNFRTMLLLRAELKGTSYGEELLPFRQEMEEREAKKVKSSEEVKSGDVLTTEENEIDPNADLDEQIGTIIEGEMRDKELRKQKSSDPPKTD